MKGFLITILFLMLFSLPLLYYYTKIETYYPAVYDYRMSEYYVFFPKVIQTNNQTILTEIITDRNYDGWSKRTGFRLEPVIWCGETRIMYDSFHKRSVSIQSADQLTVRINGTETSTNVWTGNLTRGDELEVIIPKKCTPFIRLHDGSKIVELRLSRPSEKEN